MTLDLLPARTAGAAENMAVDFLLLQRYAAGRARCPRFRRYDWRRAAFTFGYAQKIAFVRAQLAGVAEPFDLCRRPTGGGMVDHREDWTYALVIPRGHALEETRAAHSYRAVHEALAAALQAQGVDAIVKPCEDFDADEAADGPAGVCFQRAEAFDVVQRVSGVKIAGAAQKRNKHGLLFQGSIWRPAVSGGRKCEFDWEAFEGEFTTRLGAVLAMEPAHVPWPEIDDEEVSALTEQYASPEWNEFR